MRYPKRSAAMAGVLWLAACTSPPTVPMAPPGAILNDNDIALPTGYRSWPVYLGAVQRPDAKQVREIYMNPAAAGATAASGFANGTVFVMENYAAQVRPDGTLARGSDGKLIKGALVRIFVQGKGAGWGQAAPPELRNGSWVYASFLPDGRRSGDDTAACRSCHLSVADKDFVHRYDEHFAQKRPARPASSY